MKKPSNPSRQPISLTRRVTRRPGLFLVVVVLIMAVLACGKSKPTPTTAPTKPPEPTQTEKIVEATPVKPNTPTVPLPTDTATPIPTPTEILGLRTIVDDGSPLAPQIVQQQPANGQEVALDGTIEITFDQPMDQAATGQALQVASPDGKALAGDVTWPSATTLLFKPSQQFTAGTVYMARLNTKAVSAKGVALRDDVSFEFNVVGELQVSQVFPADQTTDVESKSAITVIFNRPVTPLVIAEQQANLPSPLQIDPPLEGTGEWINTSVYVFRPAKFLKGSTTYHVTVAAGLADAAGLSTLAADYTWQFSTVAPSIDSYYLNGNNYWGYNPPDGYINVPLDQGFTVMFRQEMDRASVEAAFAIRSYANQEIAPAAFTWNDASTQVEITPTQRLALGTDYVMHLGKEALSSDGGTLQDGLDWQFTTVRYPEIANTIPTDGARQSVFDGMLQIYFTCPMDFSTLKDKVTITPALPDPLEWYYSEDIYNGAWSIYTYGLAPSTAYQVQIQPGMADKYGNLITEAYTFSFSTGPRSPWAYLQMPYGAALYRTGGSQEFYVNSGNVRSLSLGAYTLSPEQFVAFQNYSTPQEQYQPSRQDLVWSLDESGKGDLNQSVLKGYTPTQPDGSPLKPGFYLLTINTPSVSHTTPFVDTRRMILATANLTIKYTQTEALMWLTDLTTGNPVAGISITVYDRDFKPLGNGVTDANGLLYLSDILNPNNYYTLYAMTDMGQAAFAFAASDWGSGVSPYDFGVWEEYYSYTNQPKAYVYTERPLYRPDQPVYFKGIVRIDNDLAYSLATQSQVKVTIANYDTTVYEETLPLSAMGTFNGEFKLDKQAALGYYTINVSFPDEDAVIGSVFFSVAEYHTPEFLVNVTADQKDVVGGDSFNATIAAEYYSGGGLVNANVHWTLVANPFYFTPPDGKYSSYSFNEYEQDLYYFTNTSGSYMQQIAEGDAVTDENGKAVVTLPTDLSKYKSGATLTFEATVTDLSQNAVSARTDVVAHRSQVYPGLKPDVYVGTEGKPLTVLLTALDWSGNPVPGQTMSVEIVERRWHSVQEEDQNGNLRWNSTVEEIPVTRFDSVTMDAEGNGSVNFTPPNGGVFMARTIAQDAGGREGRATAYMWVAGKDYVPWRQQDNRTFELVFDKTQYNPGDTAQILIASPFQGDVYALVTVERGHIRKSEVVQLTSNSTVYSLPISADMAPGVYVSVLIIKGVDDTNPHPDFRMSIAKVQVSTAQQLIQVSVTPDQAQAGPGQTVVYTVRTKDANGQPVDAEVSLGLSDLAVLSLMDPNSSPIQDYFYAERGLSVWTSVPIVSSIEFYNAELAARQDAKSAEGMGMGSGGGKGEGDFGVMSVRERFLDTAYWNATVETGASGETTVSVTLPDNLTTWRMDARAVTADTRVGQTTNDIISTLPLLVRPQTPRFFVVGDQATLGAAVHNNTDQELTVQVSLQAVGVNLQSEGSQTVTIPARRQAYVTWEAVVRMDATRVDLVFSATGGEYSDASRPPLGTLDNQGIPVYSYEAPETVGTSGQLTAAGTQIEAISLPSEFTVSAGTLTVQVAPSLAAGMTDGLDYLKTYPYECIEQTISSFLPNVLTLKALQAAGVSNPDLEANLKAQLDVALQRLDTWQNADGGWGWWGGQESDPLTSAYVTLGLALTRDAGYTVNDEVLSRGLGYVRSQLRSTQTFSEPYLLNRQAFLLYVLARAGEPDVSYTVKLYDLRQGLAIFARAMLAHTLYIIDPGDTRLKTLLSDFNNAAILSATGTHWEEETVDYWNWNTDTRTTAIVLSALSYIDPQNPLNANAVRWLMSSRTNGHWAGTQETSWTLMALTHWMEASGELNANYQYGVALNGERIGGGVANADTLRDTLNLTVDISQLLKDQANRLAFARDEGAGTLYYTAHLNVSLPVEQTKALNRGIIVSRSYYYPDAPNTPVTTVKQGDIVLVRVTIVAPNALHFVIVDDPLPAGMEAIDQSLNTSPQNIAPTTYTWEDMFFKGWGWWWFDNVQMKDERVTFSADYLPAGTYLYSYLARASTLGTFHVIPTTAQEFYFPEVYGRGDGSVFTINP